MRGLYAMLLLAAGEVPFGEFRQGFAEVLEALFGIFLMVSLGVTVLHAMQGEPESAKKMLKWFAVALAGFVLFNVLSGL